MGAVLNLSLFMRYFTYLALALAPSCAFPGKIMFLPYRITKVTSPLNLPEGGLERPPHDQMSRELFVDDDLRFYMFAHFSKPSNVICIRCRRTYEFRHFWESTKPSNFVWVNDSSLTSDDDQPWDS